MRAGIWLYLDLLARRPDGAETFEVEPAAIGREMGLPDGTIRSWLGHLRKAGYLEATRLNGAVRVTLARVHESTRSVESSTAQPSRLFTPESLEKAFGERGQREVLEAALKFYSDDAVRRALAGTLAVPAPKIRRSRTALFLYLLKQYAHVQD